MERRKRRLKMDFPPSPMRCADPPFGEICAPPQTIVSTGSQISVPSVLSCSTAWIRLWGSLRDFRIALPDKGTPSERSADSFAECGITNGALGATASWTAAVLCRFRFARRSWKSASRRRAEAALWRAAKAGGLAHSKTWRNFVRFRERFAVWLRIVYIASSFIFWFFPRPVKRNHSYMAAIHADAVGSK